MDNITLIRIISAVLAVAVFFVLAQRMKKRTTR